LSSEKIGDAHDLAAVNRNIQREGPDDFAGCAFVIHCGDPVAVGHKDPHFATSGSSGY
jgi:hypothetical protein